MTAIELSVAAILLGLFAILLLAAFGVAMLRASAWSRRARISAQLAPSIRDAVAEYMAGSEDLTRIRAWSRQHRNDLAEALIAYRGKLSGVGLTRLGSLAMELGLVSDWVRDTRSRDAFRRRTAFSRLVAVAGYDQCRTLVRSLMFHALKDDDAEVRLWAARGVVEAGSDREIRGVFELAVSQNLLVRILLADALRRHAASLCENVVPWALRSDDTRKVLTTLEVLVAWERTVTVDNLEDLLEHRVKEIRLQALRLIPMVNLQPEHRTALIRALNDPDPDIKTAAALSVGKIKLEEALPMLARLLRLAPAELARTAAAGLAEMPTRGWQALEELSASSNPVTSAAAAEALGRARQRVRS
jgi:hypothetical protein